jgi:arginine repressor
MALNIHKIEEAIFNLEDCLTLPEIEEMLVAQGFQVTKPGLIRWIKKYPIGIKVAGRYYVQPEKLALLLEGRLAPKINPNATKRKK